MLLESEIANLFLSKYKSIMTFLNGGVEPNGHKEYGALRPLVYENIEEADEWIIEEVGLDFINAIKSSIYGKFIYLKRYQKGYAFLNVDTNKYYLAFALTTPLEQLINEYSLIETALVPFDNKLVCDGLFVSSAVYIGKNMSDTIRKNYWTAKRAGELITNA